MIETAARAQVARPSSVLIASANDQLRDGLRRAVAGDDRFALAGESTTLASTVDRLGRAPFLDLVVLDHRLPGLDDDRGLQDLTSASPGSAVAFHPGRKSATTSGWSDPVSFVAALGNGVVGHARTMLFPGSPTAGDARRFVDEACRREGAGAISESAQLVASELVTNARNHGQPPVGLHLELAPATVRIDVRDANPSVPAVLPEDPQAMTGRGLRLVGAFAMAWGFHHVIGGKAIWAVLARPH